MASASINNLIAQINKTPPVYPNLFVVMFDPVPGMSIFPDNERFTLSCETAQLPGKALMTFEAPAGYNSPLRVYPYSENFAQELTLSFRLGTDFYEKIFFDEWMNLSINPITKFSPWPEQYKTSIYIYQLDKNLQSLIDKGRYTKKGFFEQIKEGFKKNILDPIRGQSSENLSESSDVSDFERIIYGVKYEDAFVTQVSPIELDSTGEEGFSSVEIEFSYRQWVQVDASGNVISPKQSTTTNSGVESAARTRIQNMKSRNQGIVEREKQKFIGNTSLTDFLQ